MNGVSSTCVGVTIAIPGCTDPLASNYNASATVDDGSCIGNGVDVTFTILTDNYPEETTWSVTDASGAAIMSGGPYSGSATNYTSSACVETGCYNVTINDSFGDGICCEYGTGNYTITSAGNTLVTGGDFTSSETTNFCVTSDNDTPGCMNSSACNYNSNATSDDGSCESSSCAGCTNSDACNYDSTATIDDGSCEFISCVVFGCMDASACNFDSTADYDDGSCEYTSCACTGDINGDGVITVADVLLVLSEFGCLSGCTADVDGDAYVNVADILLLLASFGTAC